jgi:UDP-N-acetylmuramoyl-L-alanyl-D-glutamate--2,6-diaminopimelate ligase
MILENLLSAVPQSLLRGASLLSSPTEVQSLAYDSRLVTEGALFFAIEGLLTDGHLFLNEAIDRGAIAVVSERESPVQTEFPWIQVTDIRRFMALTAASFYDQPSKKLRLVGVTGTNGKTTTSYLIHSVLRLHSSACMLGTIKTIVADQEIESRLTTPESTELQAALNEAVEKGCKLGVMEVSSHAIHFDRVFGCQFPVAVFTNLSQDHLDFHGDITDYFETKRKLFDPDYNTGIEKAIVNGDDPFGRALAGSPGPKYYSYGLAHSCDVYPLSWESTLDGIKAQIHFGGRELEVSSQLVGTHNLYNLLAAATACDALGIADPMIQEGISALANVPGRFERVPVKAPFSVFIDFAHSPAALDNVLDLARNVTRGRVICVFGCGGDRDRAKRPRMGKIAVQKADLAIITDDNPRLEDPLQIIRDIEEGAKGYSNSETVPNRRKAIERALVLARQGDLVLLAGKGHETYQDIQGQKLPFNERSIVEEALCSN